ncbi:MAG: hypothetical protein HRT74_13300, partial [Flavobacteriales bacterium]|nr:hypothetical protein [Flavobacteriales bacterium]
MKLHLSILFCFFTAVAMSQLEPQSLEQLVNATIDGTQSQPEIAVSDDGSYIVIWNDVGGDSGLNAKRFDSNHNAVGEDFQVNNANFELVRAHYIGQDQYVIATLNSGGIANFFILNSDNTVSLPVSIASGLNYIDIDVHNSIMAITYEDDSNDQVYLSRYDLSLNDWIGNTVLVSENQSNDYSFPHVRFHQDGSMVVAYIFYINTSGCCDYDRRVMRKTFNSNAVAEIPEQQIFSSVSDQFVLYGMSADVNVHDELLIVTASGTTSSSRRSRCWILDRDGNFIVNQDFLLSDGSSTTVYSHPQCAFYDNGDFVAGTTLRFGGFQNPDDSEAYVLYA